MKRESDLTPPAAAAAGFLDTTQTVSALATLIESAEQNVWLVSPYVKLVKIRHMMEKVRAALIRGVEVNLVIRASDASTAPPDASEKGYRTDLQAAGLKIFTVRDLHAKVYFSESMALVTSLNLLDSSINNSVEIGMVLPAGDPQFTKLREFFGKEIEPRLAADAVKESAPPSGQREVKPRRPWASEPRRRPEKRSTSSVENILKVIEVLNEEPGSCIACGDEVGFDMERPFCWGCYQEWDKDKKGRQSHCHGCGKSHRSATFERPLCKPCFMDLD